ncbi:histidine phosphatase family protein [Paraflavitalea soli]|uniref:Histidine phosphatase family protein n=1 Tax=Paraflavitalea soli TaxID=2315862 RepID=A0A3B7MKB5_9BACT|nr:histidine phosphatase family protein [Paraflavitalea soli]AXY74628.1 histidine phosphatase family protein [Paraflavitalea soli]
MKVYPKSLLHPLVLLFCLLFTVNSQARQQGNDLRIVLIRHAEKASAGPELSCQGINRSKALPPVLHAKIGLPVIIYVPQSSATQHARMRQTILPFTEKYHLPLNDDYKVGDIKGVAKNIRKQTGTVLVVWEHKSLVDIAKQLGVKEELNWDADDFDSIWIITFSKKGKARLAIDQEGLHPSAKCP